jgi:ABC-type multidrug transport system ATPase subunit
MAAITCEGLTKMFKKATVLDDITMEIEEGALYGVLGADGAGKTTLLKLLTGLLKPTSGSCLLFGKNVTKDPAKALQNVGCLVGDPAFYQNYTAEQNLQLFADLLGVNGGEILESAGITYGSSKIEHLTYSMKKQLGVAVALLGAPQLLLLDEPLTYLDTATRNQVKTVLQDQAKEKTILFTTNTAEDIKEVATEAVILKKGEIAAKGPVKTLPLNSWEVEQ